MIHPLQDANVFLFESSPSKEPMMIGSTNFVDLLHILGAQLKAFKIRLCLLPCVIGTAGDSDESMLDLPSK